MKHEAGGHQTVTRGLNEVAVSQSSAVCRAQDEKAVDDPLCAFKNSSGTCRPLDSVAEEIHGHADEAW